MEKTPRAREFARRVLAALKSPALYPWDQCSCGKGTYTEANKHAGTCPVRIDFKNDLHAACTAITEAMNGYDPRSDEEKKQ